jgi:hypothetical protein
MVYMSRYEESVVGQKEQCGLLIKTEGLQGDAYRRSTPAGNLDLQGRPQQKLAPGKSLTAMIRESRRQYSWMILVSEENTDLTPSELPHMLNCEL